VRVGRVPVPAGGHSSFTPAAERPPVTRDEHLAATFERIAAEIRDGEATVYGYDVDLDSPRRERGGIACSLGWVEFEISDAP